jgi:hypothetical protein
MVQEESTVIPERATDPLTGKESFIFRMADQNKAAGRRTLRVLCQSAFKDLGTVLL